jgi:hypothetical protein
LISRGFGPGRGPQKMVGRGPGGDRLSRLLGPGSRRNPWQRLPGRGDDAVFGAETLRPCRRPRLGRASPKVHSMPRVLLPSSSVRIRACRIRSSCSVCFVRPSRPEHTPLLCVKAAFLFLLFQVSGLFVGNRDVRASESCFSRKVRSEVSVSRRRGSPSARSALPLTRTFTRPRGPITDSVENTRRIASTERLPNVETCSIRGVTLSERELLIAEGDE